MKRGLPVPVRLILGLAGLVLLGTLLLLLPGISTQQLAVNEALFTAVSALTATGLSVITPVNALTPFGQVVLLALIQVGGIGFMAFTVILFRLAGRRITLVDRLALRNMLGAIEPNAVLQLLTQVGLAVLLIEAAGAVLLWFNWRGMLGDERAAWYAIFHAVSAFCNAGFDLFYGLPEFRAGVPTDWATLTILGILIVCGSLGVPVIADLLNLPRDRRLTLHTTLTLSFVAVLIVAGTLGLFLAERQEGGVLTGLDWPIQMGRSFFQAVATRSAGFVGLPSFERLSPPSQLLMMALMFIGAAPAAMGGGITTGTALVLTLAVWSYARNRPVVEIGQRSISNGTVQRAAAVLTVSLLVVAVATWLLLITHPGATLQMAIFEVVSAFATCGLTLAFTSQLNLVGQLIIALVMFWGRLGALTIMVALARPKIQPLVQYPEEPILIG